MTIGDKIPEVLGIDQDGREIKAADYRGRKIVLYSYPKANTSGCTAEACSLQAHKEELAAAGYEIIGVSKDKQALQKKFADAHGLQFPLIADTDTTLLLELGCWGEKVACGRKTIGILRTTYLVNEEGVIEKIFTPKEIKTDPRRANLKRHQSVGNAHDAYANIPAFCHLSGLDRRLVRLWA